MSHVKHTYTPSAVAEIKKVSRATVFQAMRLGVLPFETTACGGQRLISRQQMEKWHPTPGKPGRKKKG